MDYPDSVTYLVIRRIFSPIQADSSHVGRRCRRIGKI